MQWSDVGADRIGEGGPYHPGRYAMVLGHPAWGLPFASDMTVHTSNAAVTRPAAPASPHESVLGDALSGMTVAVYSAEAGDTSD